MVTIHSMTFEPVVFRLIDPFITAAGKKQLASDLSRWQHMVEVIGAVMHRAPEGDEA